jgi:hypothetical protein
MKLDLSLLNRACDLSRMHVKHLSDLGGAHFVLEAQRQDVVALVRSTAAAHFSESVIASPYLL